MKQEGILVHKFVEFIPDVLENGTLYISLGFTTLVHKCCCGCGMEVVTPLSPTDWKFIFDGETVSLDPSIGNWSFECKSHYWIKDSRIKWAPRWSQQQVDAGRAQDQLTKQKHFGERDTPAPNNTIDSQQDDKLVRSLWRRFKRSLMRL